MTSLNSFVDKILESGALKPKIVEELTPTGKIVGIIRRKWRQYCGILQENVLPNVNFEICIEKMCKQKNVMHFVMYSLYFCLVDEAYICSCR